MKRKREKMYNKQTYLLLKKIKQLDLYDLLQENNVMIAGGAIRSVFANEKIKDYDLYFKTKKELLEVKSHISKDFDLVSETDNAYTFSKNNAIIQIIRMPEMILEDPQHIIDQFDYSICMGIYDIKQRKFILGETFLEDIARKELRYNIGRYPLASLFRIRKYLQRGYYISGTEIIKIGLAINNLNMRTYGDLKVQLQGIDTLFLRELTDKLLSDEYSEKEYDFMEFIDMINEYYNEKFENLFGG